MEKENEKLRIVKEKAHAEGKEPFDFAKFVAVYPHDRGGCERLKPDEPKAVQRSYEEEYYLDHPEVKTIREFAKALDEIDESY